MPLYRVLIEKKAIRQLNRLPDKVKISIDKSIEILFNRPKFFGKKIKKLVDTAHSYRLRVGDYRVLYTIDEETKTVRIYEIDLRARVY